VGPRDIKWLYDVSRMEDIRNPKQLDLRFIEGRELR
jgi:hypothetical protein